MLVVVAAVARVMARVVSAIVATVVAIAVQAVMIFAVCLLRVQDIQSGLANLNSYLYII